MLLLFLSSSAVFFSLFAPALKVENEEVLRKDLEERQKSMLSASEQTAERGAEKTKELDEHERKVSFFVCDPTPTLKSQRRSYAV